MTSEYELETILHFSTIVENLDHLVVGEKASVVDFTQAFANLEQLGVARLLVDVDLVVLGGEEFAEERDAIVGGQWFFARSLIAFGQVRVGFLNVLVHLLQMLFFI